MNSKTNKVKGDITMACKNVGYSPSLFYKSINTPVSKWTVGMIAIHEELNSIRDRRRKMIEKIENENKGIIDEPTEENTGFARSGANARRDRR